MSLPGQVSGHFTWRSHTRLDFEVDEVAGVGQAAPIIEQLLATAHEEL